MPKILNIDKNFPLPTRGSGAIFKYQLPNSGGAEKTPGQKTEQTTVDTDQVDREIERLKEKKQALEAQIRMTEDERQRQALERELQMIESALSFKDNDTYRKQNAIMI